METLKVTLLGTGRPIPVMDRFGPSALVEAGTEKLIFDCGRGAAQRLYQVEGAFGHVTALFVTHLHSDHVVGIPDVWLTGWLLGRKNALRVWGPTGTAAMMSHLEQAYDADIRLRRDDHERLPGAGAVIVAQEVDEGVVYETSALRVSACRVNHVEPALGYRVDFDGRAVVLAGDTGPSENLERIADGADVVILNVIVPSAFRAQVRMFDREQQEQILRLHTTPEEAGQIFTRVKPRLAVYTHVSPGHTPDLVPLTRTTYQGPLEVGSDLMVIDIGETVEVRPAAP